MPMGNAVVLSKLRATTTIPGTVCHLWYKSGIFSYKPNFWSSYIHTESAALAQSDKKYYRPPPTINSTFSSGNSFDYRREQTKNAQSQARLRHLAQPFSA